MSHVRCFVQGIGCFGRELVLSVWVFLNELGARREFHGWCRLESLQHSAKSVQMIGLDLMIWFVCSWFFSGGRGWCFLFLLFNSWREKRVFWLDSGICTLICSQCYYSVLPARTGVCIIDVMLLFRFLFFISICDKKMLFSCSKQTNWWNQYNLYVAISGVHKSYS